MTDAGRTLLKTFVDELARTKGAPDGEQEDT